MKPLPTLVLSLLTCALEACATPETDDPDDGQQAVAAPTRVPARCSPEEMESGALGQLVVYTQGCDAAGAFHVVRVSKATLPADCVAVFDSRTVPELREAIAQLFESVGPEPFARPDASFLNSTVIVMLEDAARSSGAEREAKLEGIVTRMRTHFARRACSTRPTDPACASVTRGP